MPRERRAKPWLDTGPTGNYYMFWYDPKARQTRRLSLRTDDPATAASRFAAALETGVAEYPSDRPPAMTVSEALDLYWKAHVLGKHIDADGRTVPNVVDIDRQEYAITLLKRHFGDQLIRALTFMDVDDYTDARRSGRLVHGANKGRYYGAAGGSTIRRELAVLSAAFNCAVKHRRISRDDVPKFDRPKTHRSRCAWLFDDELALLRLTAEGRVADFIEIAYFTAARAASVERLTVFQIDAACNTIDLSPPGDVATNKRRPVVPVVPELKPTLLRLRQQAIDAGETYLLGRPSSIRYQWDLACKASGLSRLPAREMRRSSALTPHLLRHSRATHLLQSGVDIYAVASLLGDNPMTVARVYAHACSSALLRQLGVREGNG